MLFPYFAEVMFDPAIPAKAAALVHPGGLLTSPYHFRAIDLVGKSNAVVPIEISRYTTNATGGAASTSYSFVDGAPTAGAQVLDSTASFPGGSPNFAITAYAQTRASGGGIVFPTSNNSITILPDHTLVFRTIDADPKGVYTIRLFWGEPAPIIPLMGATTLAGSSAFTVGSYFEIPPGVTALTFVVTYAAANPSALARPKYRVSWGRGATAGILQPIRSTTLDLSALPVASRPVYLLEQEYPSAITQGTSVAFAVSCDVLPGMTKARLDLAELGSPSTPGTVTVGVTGS